MEGFVSINTLSHKAFILGLGSTRFPGTLKDAQAGVTSYELTGKSISEISKVLVPLTSR
jgi:hypothetical protein